MGPILLLVRFFSSVKSPCPKSKWLGWFSDDATLKINMYAQVTCGRYIVESMDRKLSVLCSGEM